MSKFRVYLILKKKKKFQAKLFYFFNRRTKASRSKFRMIYSKFYIKTRINFVFWSLPNFQAYRYSFFYVRKLIYYTKFIIFLRYFFTKIGAQFSRLKKMYNKLFYPYLFYFYFFIQFYNFFFRKSFFDLLVFNKYYRIGRRPFIYKFYFTFYSPTLFINIKDAFDFNFFFMSNGFFNKFFGKRKSFKKNKLARFLMMKYLRKLMLISKLKRATLYVKNNPVMFFDLIKTFNQTILHPFYDPLAKKIIKDEHEERFLVFKQFIFRRMESYVKNKIKKPGRVKRKISRKVVMKNRLVD